MKKMNKKMIASAVAVLLILIAAFWIKSMMKQDAEQTPKPQQEETLDKNRSDVTTTVNSSGTDWNQGGNEIQTQEVEPYCGDEECNGRESCSTCKKDCGCDDNAICSDGKCKTIECTADEDCVDDDACSIDKCYFPGHPNSFCSTEVITTAKHKDGCCPEGMYFDKDSDCTPVCGDGRCEYGENEANCLEDCEFYGEHGGTASSGPVYY